MAVFDPNQIIQIDSRITNIKTTVEQRFATNEKNINEFVEKLQVIMKDIENNDSAVEARPTRWSKAQPRRRQRSRPQ